MTVLPHAGEVTEFMLCLV